MEKRVKTEKVEEKKKENRGENWKNLTNKMEKRVKTEKVEEKMEYRVKT